MNIPYKGQPLFGVQKRDYIYQHVESEVLILTVEVFNKSKTSKLANYSNSPLFANRPFNRKTPQLRNIS